MVSNMGSNMRTGYVGQLLCFVCLLIVCKAAHGQSADRQKTTQQVQLKHGVSCFHGCMQQLCHSSSSSSIFCHS